MASRRGHAAMGLLVPDPRIRAATISSTLSAYTEGSPQAGGIGVPADPGSLARIAVTGAQDVAVTAYCLDAGDAGSGVSAAQWGWYETASGAASVRGWDLPTAPSWTPGIAAAWAGAGTTYSSADMAQIPRTGAIVATYAQTAAAQTAYSSTWSPSTRTWAAAATIASTLGSYPTVAVAALPGERERLVSVVWALGSDYAGGRLYYSDDVGTTWALGGTTICDVAPTAAGAQVHRSRLLATPGGDLLWLLSYTVASPTRVALYHSASRGASFRQTYNNAVKYSGIDGCVMASGAIGLVTILQTDSIARWHRLGAPWYAPDDVTGVQISALTLAEVVCWVEPDGRIFVSGRENTAAYLDQWWTWTSVDEGQTWQALAHGVYEWADNADYLTAPTWHAAQGGAVCLSRLVAASGPAWGGSLLALECGGWSSLTLGYSTGARTVDPIIGRAGYGIHAVAGVIVRSFVPIDTPNNLAGFATTAAGGGAATRTIVSPGRFRQACTLNADGETYAIATGASYAEAAIELHLDAVTTTAGGREVARADQDNAGASHRDVSIRVRNDGGATTVEVWDGIAAASLAIGNVSFPCIVRLFRAGDSVYCAWRVPTSPEWVEIYDGVCATAASASTNLLTFGIRAAAGASTATTVDFGFVGLLARTTTSTLWGTASDTASLGRPVGRPLLPGDVPWDITAAGLVSSLRLVGGPAYYAEAHAIAVGSDYPVEALCWDIAPSARRVWQSVDDGAAERVAWAPSGSLTHLGTTSQALYVDGSGQRYEKLQGWTGAAWVALGTLDHALWAARDATLTGDVVEPRAGTVAGTRPIYRDELAGGTAKIVGATTAWVRIASNTEGVWREPGGARMPMVVLDRSVFTGVIPADGNVTVELWSPRGVLVVHGVTAKYSAFSVLLDAQDTCRNKHQIGVAIVGAFAPFGQPWSRGYQREYAPNTEAKRASDGTPMRRKLGPVMPSTRVAWAEGIDQTQIQGGDPDWYSVGVGSPALVNFGDVPYLAAGVLGYLDAGACPVVALPLVSATSGASITDPTLMHYGYIAGPVSLEHVLGNEGTSELLRVMSIPIEVIP